MPRKTVEEEAARIHQFKEMRAFGDRDRLGTLNHIDAAARKRAVAALSSGETVSLGRPLLVGDPDFSIDSMVTEPFGRPPCQSGRDEIRLSCHGLRQTHIDALNHLSYDGTWYSGWPIDGSDGPSVFDWARTGIFTRAVHANIGAVQGRDWVDPARPVSGDDIEAALDAAGVVFEPGDALLLDMGRDSFEAAGNEVGSQWRAERGHMQPGLGIDGAEWVARHKVAVVCWDFQDAVHPDLRRFSAHPLIWAIGQVFVDNCSFGALRAARQASGAAAVGALVLAPLRIPGGTGASINPLFIG